MKNNILIAVTAIAAIVFLVSCLSLDTMPYIVFIPGMLSGIWLMIFTYANQCEVE